MYTDTVEIFAEKDSPLDARRVIYECQSCGNEIEGDEIKRCRRCGSGAIRVVTLPQEMAFGYSDGRQIRSITEITQMMRRKDGQPMSRSYVYKLLKGAEKKLRAGLIELGLGELMQLHIEPDEPDQAMEEPEPAEADEYVVVVQVRRRRRSLLLPHRVHDVPGQLMLF